MLNKFHIHGRELCKYGTAFHMENHVRACVLSVFRAVKMLNGFEWLDETGSKFRFQNTCEKAKYNILKRSKMKIAKVPFFRDTLYHVSCIMYHISCIMNHVSYIMYHESCTMTCIMYHVSYIMYQVSCIVYHVSCILYHASCTMPHESCIMHGA